MVIAPKFGQIGNKNIKIYKKQLLESSKVIKLRFTIPFGRILPATAVAERVFLLNKVTMLEKEAVFFLVICQIWCYDWRAKK